MEAFWRRFAAAYPNPDALDGVFEERRWLDGPNQLRMVLEAQVGSCNDVDVVRLWEALHEVPLHAFNIEPYADAVAAVETLAAAGYRIGIVTNRPFSERIARRELIDQGFPEVIEAIVVAGEIGYRKPHESMFSAALDALAIEAGDAVMVGDLYEQDIVPAAKLGMKTVLKLNDRSHDYRHPLAQYAISSLEELPRLPFFTTF